jgi:hypothetical protein
MRSAGNFHPEWGYLAPAPSFVRTLRIVAVATAIGATAGAAVVVSLVARPASTDSSIAAHALVTGVPLANAAAGAVKPTAAQPVSAQPASAQAAAVAAPIAANPQAAAIGANPAGAAPPPQMASAPDAPAGAAPAHTAHIEEPAAAPAHDDAALAPEAAPGKKAETKRHRLARYEAMRRWQSKKPQHNGGGGFDPLFRLFSSRGGSLFSTN